MLLLIFKKLGVGDLKQTNSALKFAVKSYKKPWGVVEDLLVKVDNFVFFADFNVLDIDVDLDVLVILGRPFLAALIDVTVGNLIW